MCILVWMAGNGWGWGVCVCGIERVCRLVYVLVRSCWSEQQAAWFWELSVIGVCTRPCDASRKCQPVDTTFSQRAERGRPLRACTRRDQGRAAHSRSAPRHIVIDSSMDTEPPVVSTPSRRARPALTRVYMHAPLRNDTQRCASMRIAAYCYTQLCTATHNDAPLCTNMHNHATNTHNYVTLRNDTHRYAQRCTAMHSDAQLCTAMHSSTPLCTAIHRYAQTRTNKLNYATLRTTTRSYA